MATKKTNNKTSLGLEQNLAGALSYAVGWVTGLIFLLTEKENKFVRFHAMQAIITFGFLNLLVLIPIVGWMLSPFVALLTFALWLVSMLKAYQGEKFHLPIAGEIAEKQLKKLKI
jgi:uncharacterized membrane protein